LLDGQEFYMCKVYCEYVYIDSLLDFISHYGITYLSGEKQIHL